MTDLRQLNVNGCRQLTLPPYLGSLGSLQQLNLGGCWRLPRLPSGIGSLSRLQHLDLSN